MDDAEHSTAPMMEATKVHSQVETLSASSAGVERKNHLGLYMLITVVMLTN